jgi:hypothetical protein
MAACAPIENRETLKNAYDPNNIDLTVVHNLPGSNVFTLKVNTPGVAGYWDYLIGRSFSDEVTVALPFSGTHTMTYTVSSPYIPNGDLSKREIITKTLDVTITLLEEGSVPVQWEYLAGNGSKTWVFDKSAPNDGFAGFWYMSGYDDIGAWWVPSPPSDQNGRMVFSREGSSSFTYYASPNATGIGNTSWYVNSSWTELRLAGDANILGVEGGAVHETGSKTYRIIELTEDRMVLLNSKMVWDSGWVWVFKPE